MKKDIDFLKVYIMQNKKKYKRTNAYGGKIRVFVIFIIIAVVSTSFGLFGYSKILQKRLELLELEMENSVYVSAYQLITLKQTQYIDVKTYNQMVQDAKNQILVMPKFTNLEYVTLKNSLSQDMQILSMNYSSGTYVVTFTAPFTRKVPEYITNIRKSGIFDDVSYTGYSMQAYNMSNTNYLSELDPTLENKNQYVFTATCILKRGVSDEIK